MGIFLPLEKNTTYVPSNKYNELLKNVFSDFEAFTRRIEKIIRLL